MIYLVSIFDAYLLPFFHLGSVPVKFAVIAIPLLAVLRGKLLNLAWLFAGLIGLNWVGKSYAYFFLAEPDVTQTIWVSMNYALIAAGLCCGYHTRFKNLDWTFYLALAYIVVHFLIVLTWQYSSFIVWFYDLQERIDSGLLELRSVGVVTNPNVAALMMNMLLIFWGVAKYQGQVTKKSFRYELILFLGGMLVILSTGSKSGLLAFVAILLIRSWHVLMSAWRRVVQGLLFAFVFISVSIFVAGQVADDERFVTLKNGLDLAANLPARLEHEIVEGTRIKKLVFAYENWLLSPIFGIGSDRASSAIVNDVFYHNDFSEILVSTGILGLLMYFYLTYRVFRISPLLVVPFFLPGATNAFIFTVHLAMMYFSFIGIIMRVQKIELAHGR